MILKTLQYVTDNDEGKKELASNYGGAISPASLGCNFRSIVALEQQGATSFSVSRVLM